MKSCWYPKIGLEVHVQLHSKQKLFSKALASSNALFNENVEPFDVALPGSLPVFNRTSVLQQALKAALALNCNIKETSYFDRKHYFYRDLPAGYQITQFFEPFAVNGKLFLNSFDTCMSDSEFRTEIEIPIPRIQIEQDSAKTWTNIEDGDHSNDEFQIDYNRSGVPLLEIVTGPTIESGKIAKLFLKKLSQVMQLAGVMRDPSTQEGGFRFDVNVSVSQNPLVLGTRCEIKNMSAWSLVDGVIGAEIERQIAILEKGQSVEPATIGFCAETMQTFVRRSKEAVKDYRFMRDPDLQPLIIHNNEIERARQSMTESLDDVRSRLLSQYEATLNQLEINTLIKHNLVKVFECAAGNGTMTKARIAKELLLDKVVPFCNQNSSFPLENISKIFPQIVSLTHDSRLPVKKALDLMSKILNGQFVCDEENIESALNDAGLLVSRQRLAELEKLSADVVKSLIAENPKLVSKYPKKKDRIISVFVRLFEKKLGSYFEPTKIASWFKNQLEERRHQ